MMRPYITTQSVRTSEPLELNKPHPRRRMQAVLEVISPQVHQGDHATTAEILHTGSQESLAVELIRLFIYLETNNMAFNFRHITGCDVTLSTPTNVMDFLRRTGFLTKANVYLLARSTDSTSQVLLERLLLHSIMDENSCDVLGWLIQSDVNQSVQIFYDPKSIFRGVHGLRQVIHDHRDSSTTLLQAASLAGNIHAVRLLLDSGAEPYATSSGLGYSPLECAARLAHHDRAYVIADLLLSKQTRSSSESQMVALEGALQVAIAKARTELIVRLLSERKGLGRETVDSEWSTIAAKYANCDTIRLLADNSPRRDDGRVILPKCILFSALHPPYHDPDRPLNMVNCLLELGADTTVLRCRQGCGLKSLSNYIYQLHRGGGTFESKEQCALSLATVWRKHGCPLETPKSASGGDDNWGWTALQPAITGGYALLVEYLLDWGTDTDHQHDGAESQASKCDDSNHVISTRPFTLAGPTPLLMSLQCKEFEIAKILLRRDPSLRLCGGEQKLAMDADDDTELVALLLQAGSADVDGWEDFLEQAVSRRNRECTRMLLSTNYDFHAAIDPGIVLRAAVLTEDQDTILQQIAVCNYNSRALYDAVLLWPGSKDCHEIVERLLESRPDTSNDDFEVLAVAIAAIYQDLHLMGVLVGRLGQGPWNSYFPPANADLLTSLFRWTPKDEDAEYPIHILNFAATLSQYPDYNGVLETLLSFNVPATGMYLEIDDRLTADTWKRLIAVGADPNLGEPLLGAVYANELAHVEVLYQARVLVDKMHVGSHDSRTAVQAAAFGGSPEMLQMLLRYGADIDHPAGYYRGATCLQLAAGAGNIGLARFLLEKGARVNAKRALIHGRTAVEAAAERGRLDVVKLLLLQREHLFQTAAERHQFIRAAKFADIEGYKVIGKMLKQHISWNSNDQEIFEALPNDERIEYHVDGMTQELLGSESRDSKFWGRMRRMSSDLGFEDIYDIQGIEQWIGSPGEEHPDDSTMDETDPSSEGEGNIQPRYPAATEKERNETDDRGDPTGDTGMRVELQSEVDQRAPLMPVCGGIQDAMLDLESSHGHHMEEEPVIPSYGRSLNPGWGASATTVAPRAIRYEVPEWLDMQDNGRGIQKVTNDLPLQDRTWEALAHRPATQNVDQEPGIVIGEILDEVQYINATGDDAVDHNDVEDMGEVGHTHVQHFNWGIWDDESFALHSGHLAYLGIARGSAG